MYCRCYKECMQLRADSWQCESKLITTSVYRPLVLRLCDRPTQVVVGARCQLTRCVAARSALERKAAAARCRENVAASSSADVDARAFVAGEGLRLSSDFGALKRERREPTESITSSSLMMGYAYGFAAFDGRRAISRRCRCVAWRRTACGPRNQEHGCFEAAARHQLHPRR